jgi:3-oxoadipate enol-lactonase
MPRLTRGHLVAALLAACAGPGDVAENPAAWQQRTIAAGEGDSIHLAYRGLERSRVIVFVPGLADTWESYADLADAMPDSFGMVLLDPLGHGRSTKRAGTINAPRQAHAISAVLDSLRVRPFGMIGHSYGAIIAQHYGNIHSDLPAAVIMAAGTTLRGHPDAAAFNALAAGMPDSVPDSLLSMQRDGFFGEVPDSVVQRYIVASRATPGHAWREVIAHILETDTRDFLGSWRPRTLLVIPENDKVVGNTAMDGIVRAIPAADTVRIPRTSHSVHWERPDTVAQVIAAFLEKVAASR